MAAASSMEEARDAVVVVVVAVVLVRALALLAVGENNGNPLNMEQTQPKLNDDGADAGTDNERKKCCCCSLPKARCCSIIGRNSLPSRLAVATLPLLTFAMEEKHREIMVNCAAVASG